MKKSLVALAALAATTAFAQSSVTLYGNMDQSVFRSKSDTGYLLSSNSNGGSTSLWGIRGTEDLGGGTTASFDLKSELTLATGQTGSASTGLDSTTKTATVFNRGANIALANNGLGTATIGRQNDSWWETGTKFNNTGINSFGWANATAMVSGTTGLPLLYGSTNTFGTSLAGAGTTAKNTGFMGTGAAFFGGLSYATPVYNGFQFKYGKGVPKMTYTTDTDAEQVTNWSLNYGNGPLTLAYAATKRTDSNGDDALAQTLMGAKYVMGQYSFTAARNNTKVSNIARTTEGHHDAEVTALGVGYALNPKWTLNAGYTVTKDKDDSANKWTQTAVTGSYAFSKRTSWYVGYGRSANEGKSRFGGVYAGASAPGKDANSQPSVAGTNDTTIITGIRHQF